MRLFVAIDLDDDTRAQLLEARERIARRLADARVVPRLTWVRPEAAHLTVRFIGEVSDTSAPLVAEALRGVRLSRIVVRWGTLGTFGGARRPRIIWLAPTEGADAVSAIAHAVDEALVPVVGRGEARPFRPHLTLARVRDAGRDVPWVEALRDVPWRQTTTTVTRVTLYRSHLSPAGPTYTALSTHG